MQEIIQRCKENDKDAFGELFETYSTQVYQSILIMVRERNMAEDITQEIFIHLFSKIQYYDEKLPFRNWLYQVSMNIAKNHLRKHTGWNGWIKSFAPSLMPRSSALTPEKALQQKELQSQMSTYIKTLQVKTQMVIVLRYFNEFSQKEIANILQIPLGTVKWHIHIGLKKMEKIIGNEIVELREAFHE